MDNRLGLVCSRLHIDLCYLVAGLGVARTGGVDVRVVLFKRLDDDIQVFQGIRPAHLHRDLPVGELANVPAGDSMPEGDLLPFESFLLQLAVSAFLQPGPGPAQYLPLHELDLIRHVRCEEKGDSLVVSMKVVCSGNAKG